LASRLNIDQGAMQSPAPSAGTASSFVHSRRRRLPPSVKHGLTLLGGATLAQVIPALASPVISRLFNPADIGAFAFVAAVLGVITPLACLRYDVAIVLPEEDEKAAHLTALCLLVGAVAAVLSVVPLLIVWDVGRGSAARTAIPLLLTMLPAGTFLLSVQLVAQSWSLRTHSYREQSRAVIAQAVVTVVAQIALIVVVGRSAYALVLGALAGYLALVLMYLPVLRTPVFVYVRKYFSREAVIRAARSYARFPIYTGPYAFLGQMAVRVVVLVFALFTSARIVGQYAVAQRVIFLPVATLMAAASQIFYSRAARRLDDPRMPHMVQTALLAGPLILGPFFVLLMLYAEPAFSVVFGHQWRQAGHFAAILAVPSMVKTLTAWLDRTYDIRSRQGLPLVLEAAYVVIVCVATYLVLHTWADANLAIVVYAAVTVGFYLVWMVCALRVAGFPARLGAEFVVATSGVIAVVLGVDALIIRLGMTGITRFASLLLFALMLSASGVWFAMERMRAMGQLAG
jgi:O-antigen/teichoic acid export membrane protein